MRTSRFRRGDLLQLLLLRYPVRCHVCLQRRSANLVAALRLAGFTGPRQESETHATQLASPGQRTLRCNWCGSANLRLSRFQPRDFTRLLLLRYPVRCRACRERSYRFLASARKLPKFSGTRHIESGLGKSPRGL